MVVTHLEKEEEVAIPGYERIYINDKTANSGRILVGVKDNIKPVTMQRHKQEQVGGRNVDISRQ